MEQLLILVLREYTEHTVRSVNQGLSGNPLETLIIQEQTKSNPYQDGFAHARIPKRV